MFCLSHLQDIHHSVHCLPIRATSSFFQGADCFAVIDPILYAGGIAQAVTKAEARDSNYVAEYWPWVKIPDADLGRNVWVPASVAMGGVYAFNDKVALVCTNSGGPGSKYTSIMKLQLEHLGCIVMPRSISTNKNNPLNSKSVKKI